MRASFSYTPYSLPRCTFGKQDLDAAIQSRRFREIDPEDQDETESWGFVDPRDETLPPTFENTFPGPYVVLAVRRDTLRVSPAAVKRACREAEREWKKSVGAAPNKADRDDIKERVTRQLRLRTQPSVLVVHALIDPAEGVARIGSRAKSVADDVCSLVLDALKAVQLDAPQDADEEPTFEGRTSYSGRTIVEGGEPLDDEIQQDFYTWLWAESRAREGQIGEGHETWVNGFARFGQHNDRVDLKREDATAASAFGLLSEGFCVQALKLLLLGEHASVQLTMDLAAGYGVAGCKTTKDYESDIAERILLLQWAEARLKALREEFCRLRACKEAWQAWLRALPTGGAECQPAPAVGVSSPIVVNTWIPLDADFGDGDGSNLQADGSAAYAGTHCDDVPVFEIAVSVAAQVLGGADHEKLGSFAFAIARPSQTAAALPEPARSEWVRLVGHGSTVTDTELHDQFHVANPRRINPFLPQFRWALIRATFLAAHKPTLDAVLAGVRK
jgi:hypothetical protein